MRRDPLDPIFPAALQKVGYHTALIGKSGLGCNTDDSALVIDKGFDYFFGYTLRTPRRTFTTPTTFGEIPRR